MKKTRTKIPQGVPWMVLLSFLGHPTCLSTLFSPECLRYTLPKACRLSHPFVDIGFTHIVPALQHNCAWRTRIWSLDVFFYDRIPTFGVNVIASEGNVSSDTNLFSCTACLRESSTASRISHVECGWVFCAVPKYMITEVEACCTMKQKAAYRDDRLHGQSRNKE